MKANIRCDQEKTEEYGILQTMSMENHAEERDISRDKGSYQYIDIARMIVVELIAIDSEPIVI